LLSFAWRAKAQLAGRPDLALLADIRMVGVAGDRALGLKSIELFGTVTPCSRYLRMPDSFGARLRQQRERQQIALSSIAEQTKIKVSLLEELERDDLSHWPVGIFRRSFIRGYAQAIGLDPAPVLVEFLALYPDPTDIVPAPEIIPMADEGREITRPPTRLRFLVGSAISSLSRGREAAAAARPKPPENDAAVAAVSVAPAFTPPPSPSEPDLAPPSPSEPNMPPASLFAPDPTPASLFEPDLLAAAQLCTGLSRSDNSSELGSHLAEAARILDAVGLIVWGWDAQGAELRPTLAHGYSDKLLGQLPPVKRDADNATAAAFRSAELCVVDGSDEASGALVAPMMGRGGCVGVLAVEVQNRSEQLGSVRALVTIFAAQLGRWIPQARTAEMPDRRRA
jgi:transcriptional regulator with XRE-family HTH domain